MNTENTLSAEWDTLSRKDISIISIAVDAPNDVISALSGKLGKLPGVSTKAAYSKLSYGSDAE
jgi:formyltetrahydrofolate synthetase